MLVFYLCVLTVVSAGRGFCTAIRSLTPTTNCDVTLTNTADNGIHRKIFNGMAANIRDWPWMVGVYGLDDDGNVTCGGALISRNLVLTATHCYVTGIPYMITLGSSLPFEHYAADGKTIRYADLAMVNGLATLLRLRRPVRFSATIRPIRLPSAYDNMGAGQHVWVTGFGGNGTGPSPRLTWIEMHTITNQLCRRFYGNAIRDNMVCALNPMRIVCGGDSGSPVVRFEYGRYVHVGIVEGRSDTPCNETDQPAILTRTNKYTNWIISEIWRHSF